MNTKKLPIANKELEIIQAVRENNIVIVFGDTGSGKTTQLPQYIYKAKLNNNKLIGITQPRRIAAINTAKRVSQEMKCKLSRLVGYEIRFDNQTTYETKIKFMTDGILLNQCIMDPILTKYGVIIIDEVHERSICTDVILGILKLLVEKRTDLKVIITSATIESEKFSDYFHNIPVIRVDGKMFPVEEIYYETYNNTNKMVEVIKTIVQEIIRQGENGDILIFLTGEDEIEDCCQLLEVIEELVVLPLYGAMDYNSQQKVFLPVRGNERKVIVSTNIAETSITIDGIRYVIDSGFVKQNQFNIKEGIEQLIKVRISQAQANQRKGRAGRTNTGWCHRLYSIEDYLELEKQTEPEIFRKDLCQIYLKLKSMGFEPSGFDFMDTPNKDMLLKSLKELKYLQLINDDNEITKLGSIVNSLPVEPIMGKILITSANYGCSMDIITMFSMLMEKNVFLTSRKLKESLKILKSNFHDPDGDHFMLLKIYNDWITNKKSKQWCNTNGINNKVMENVFSIRKQLIKIMCKEKIPLISSDPDNNRVLIKKAILNVFDRNVCRFYKTGKFNIYRNIVDNKLLYIHPSSCIISDDPQIILYIQMFKTSKPFITGILKLDEKIFLEFNEEKKALEKGFMAIQSLLVRRKKLEEMTKSIKVKEVYHYPVEVTYYSRPVDIRQTESSQFIEYKRLRNSFEEIDDSKSDKNQFNQNSVSTSSSSYLYCFLVLFIIIISIVIIYNTFYFSK